MIIGCIQLGVSIRILAMSKCKGWVVGVAEVGFIVTVLDSGTSSEAFNDLESAFEYIKSIDYESSARMEAYYDR